MLSARATSEDKFHNDPGAHDRILKVEFNPEDISDLLKSTEACSPMTCEPVLLTVRFSQKRLRILPGM